MKQQYEIMNSQDPQKKSGLKDILPQFSESEREEISRIWEKSGKANPAGEMTSAETENALAAVHRRLDTSSESGNAKKTVIHHMRKWVTAAAVLIVFAAGLLMIPKTISAPYGEMAVVELPDGTSAELNSGTTLSYSRFFSFTSREMNLQGEAYFEVAENSLPFRVFANGTVTEVTGTRFNVRSWTGDHAETEVTVTEGEVKFYRDDESAANVTLQPGQISRWHRGLAEPALPETVSARDILAWRDQRFAFQNRTLRAIFDELERRFDTSIEFRTTGMELDTLTAYYNQPQNLERILEDICMVKGLQFAETANGYRVYK